MSTGKRTKAKNGEVLVSPCPFCLQRMPETGFVCSECRLTYQEHAQYTQKALAQYAVQAPRYDRLAAIFSSVALYPVRRYRMAALRALNIQAGDTVLDIGCGTGLSLPFIEERIGPEGRIIALDYTATMLEQAANKAEAHGWQNIAFIRGDAANVAALVARPVNAAVAAFSLSLVPGWQQSIKGVAGLLQPGGRFAVLDWQTMKARGPVRVLSPVLEWLTKRYGLADPSVNFSDERPWSEVMGMYLTDVSYRDMHLGTTFLCTGVKG